MCEVSTKNSGQCASKRGFTHPGPSEVQDKFLERLAAVLGPGVEKLAQYAEQYQGSWHNAAPTPQAKVHRNIEIISSSESSLDINRANTLVYEYEGWECHGWIPKQETVHGSASANNRERNKKKWGMRQLEWGYEYIANSSEQDSQTHKHPKECNWSAFQLQLGERILSSRKKIRYQDKNWKKRKHKGAYWKMY